MEDYSRLIETLLSAHKKDIQMDVFAYLGDKINGLIRNKSVDGNGNESKVDGQTDKNISNINKSITNLQQ